MTAGDAAAQRFDSLAIDFFYDAVFADPILHDFYGDSGYANLGYWDGAVATATEAGDRLVDRLIELVGGIDGPVLDVACGVGGTTRRLSDHVPADAISAINVSSAQLALARRRVPGASFELMDAAAMSFADNSFQTVICVEAAFHFRTRRQFLAETYRVLEPVDVSCSPIY